MAATRKNATVEQKLKVKHILERLAQAYGIARGQLPNHTGICAQQHKEWVLSGHIPHDEIHLCHLKTGVSLEWLYYNTQEDRKISVAQYRQLMMLFITFCDDAVECKLLQLPHESGISPLIKAYEYRLSRWLTK